MEIFDLKVIRKLIDSKWPLAKEFTVKLLFIPYILLLSIYIYYMQELYPHREKNDNSEWFEIRFFGSQILLILLSFYFVRSEVK